jgi:hypothetical protein
MSIVIIGGHDRMVCQYKKVCQKYQCKAKVFTQMSGNLSKKIGTPDLVVLFTNTVSHKMVQWKKQAAAMQRSSAAIQAAKTHWKISWKLPVQQCKNDQLQKSKIEEKYRKMYKKESIRYEICMVYSLLI